MSGAKVCLAGGGLELALAAAGALYGGLTWFALGALAALALESAVMAPTILRELRRDTPRADRPIRASTRPAADPVRLSE
jgi:hypothetical protein